MRRVERKWAQQNSNYNRTTEQRITPGMHCSSLIDDFEQARVSDSGFFSLVLLSEHQCVVYYKDGLDIFTRL